MFGRKPLMGETLCDAEREAVLRTGGYKGQACVTDGGQHNNIGIGRHTRGRRVQSARDWASGHLVAASARTHFQPIFTREPICQSLRHGRPQLIGEVRDKRCQNVHTPRIYHGGPINLGLEFVMSFTKITDTRQGPPLPVNDSLCKW